MTEYLINGIETNLDQLEKIFENNEDFESDEKFQELFQKVKEDLLEAVEMNLSFSFSEENNSSIASFQKNQKRIKEIKQRINNLKLEMKSHWDDENEIDYIRGIMNPNGDENDD